MRWGLYPTSWLVIITLFSVAVAGRLELRLAWGIGAGVLFASYILLESAFPYERRWKMTRSSFFADLKYIAVNGSSLGLLSALLALFTITTSGDLSGPAQDWPIWLQIPAMLLIFDACQYSIHRSMHEGSSTLNKLLWKIHAPHHLPDKLYVLMHPVGHPFNGFIIQALSITIPIWLMGYDQIAVTGFLMINGMHGLISHFNVDVRMGWFNYIFVGPELHRYHHSSALKDAKNFGSTLSIYDQLFGTFVYRPGIAPDALGAFNNHSYPDYKDIVSIMKLPFERAGK